MRPSLTCALCAIAFALTGCSEKPQPAAAASSPSPQPARARIDPCSLLTREEVAATQGAPVQNVQPSDRSGPDVYLSQCYYTLPSAADSINVIVTQRIDSNSPRDPQRVWPQMFPAERPKKIGRDGKEKPQPDPERIAGLGDDAYWAGGRFGGTLNVLKDDTMVQISVGGPGDEATKRENLKALAKNILERL